jgi:4-amino-4-deoxy-L-arabinose transferase-like glycosyltransferase
LIKASFGLSLFDEQFFSGKSSTNSSVSDIAFRMSCANISPTGIRDGLSNSKGNNTAPLFLLALLAVLITWLAMRFGIGVSPDSTVYLDAAHNLLSGRGLIALTGRGSFEPLTHYPPLYPAVLALLARVGVLLGGIPIESAARALNSFLFGASVLLVGIIIRHYARNSYWLPIIGSSLTLAAPDIAGIHTFALTEGLFVFLLLSGSVSLLRFIETKRRLWLIASAAMMAMAFLTRYVGVTLVFSGLLVLLFVNGRTWNHRCVDAVGFGLIACAPMALWTLRNMQATAGISDRVFVFHRIGLRQIITGLSTVSAWLLVGKVRTDYRAIFFVVELVAGSLLVIYLLRRRRDHLINKDLTDDATSSDGKLNKRSSPVVVLFVVFIVVYVVFLIFTTSFVDADTVLDDRSMVPVHVAAIVLGCCFAWQLFLPLRDRRSMRIAFAALAIILFGSYSIRSAGWLMRARQDGQGYASRAWKNSETIAHLRSIPVGVPIYSNGYDAIYYLTKRPAIYLPEKVIHGTGRENQDYAAEVELMRNTLGERNGLVVYFNTLPERWFLPSVSDLSQLPLSEIVTTPDGSIYKLNPGFPR